MDAIEVVQRRIDSSRNIKIVGNPIGECSWLWGFAFDVDERFPQRIPCGLTKAQLAAALDPQGEAVQGAYGIMAYLHMLAFVALEAK